jgi:hypothetical protein
MYVGFYVLTAIYPIFKDIWPCIPFKVTWRFGGTYRLCPQVRGIRRVEEIVASQKTELFKITIYFVEIKPRTTD